jgi:hypothetical protein
VQNLRLVGCSSQPQAVRVGYRQWKKDIITQLPFHHKIGWRCIWDSRPRQKESTWRTRATVRSQGFEQTKHHIQQHLWDYSWKGSLDAYIWSSLHHDYVLVSTIRTTSFGCIWWSIWVELTSRNNWTR